MQTVLLSILFATALFCGVLVCMRIGWRIGRQRLLALGEDWQAGLGTLDGAVFGLMGLLVAFTFTGAATRFDARRSLVTEHVNAIGTAWLRLDLLAAPEREKARDGFRRYVDAQLEILGNSGNNDAVRAGMGRLSSIQQEIRETLIQAAKSDKSLPLTQTVLPPVNEMFDLSTTRYMAARQHPPVAVFLMLGLPCAGQWPDGRLRHGQGGAPERPPSVRLRRPHGALRLPHSRHRISAPRYHQDRLFRPGND